MENLLDFLNKSSRNFLENESQKDKACTYIFQGRKGSNHLNIALQFIYRILCRESDEYKKSFYKNFYSIINILESEDNSVIKREDIKKMIDKSFYSSFSGRKFFIINSAENMREDSWNILLKSLEEPTNSIFILISFDSKIPTTVSSRALSVDLSPDLKKIEDIKLFEFLDYNLEDYLFFKKENLILSDLEVLSIDEALKSYIYKKGIKTKSILIRSIKEFYKNIKMYSKLDMILTAERIENIIARDKSLLHLFISLIINEYSLSGICNLELFILLKESINKNINISLILFNFLINLVEK